MAIPECKVVEIRQLSNSNADLRADGELLGKLPHRFEVVPGALRVAGVVPKTKIPADDRKNGETDSSEREKDHGVGAIL